MPNRRRFLSVLAASGAAVALSTDAQGASPAPAPSAAPTASPPPSDAALAIARGMRAYDAKLSDDEVTSIAQQIDDNWKSGKRLNPRNKRLKNSDEPVTILRVPL